MNIYVNMYVNCNYAHVFNKFVCLNTIVFVFKEEKDSEEVCNFANRGEGQARVYVEEDVRCTPITAYTSNLPKELPWENDVN